MRTSILLSTWIVLGVCVWAAAQDRTAPARAGGRAPAVALSPDRDASAPPTPIPGVTDKLGLEEKRPSELLGDRFESETAGISFRPPAGSKAVRQSDQDHVIDYTDDDRGWILKVTRAKLAQPMPLQTIKTNTGERMGLLDYTVADIQKDFMSGSPRSRGGRSARPSSRRSERGRRPGAATAGSARSRSR